jgi:hypothetical protein
MPKLLSGGVLRVGGSGQYITLPGAQPALGPSPSTGTGFTLITGPTYITEYSSSLGFIQFTSGTLYSYVPGQNISIQTTGTGTFQVFAPTEFNNTVRFNNTLTFTDLTASGLIRFTNTTTAISSTTGAMTVGGGAGIGGDLYVGGTIYGNISTASLTSLTLDTTRITVANTLTSGTFFLVLASTATGLVSPQTNGGITYNNSTGVLAITSSTASTSTNTGALVVRGGVGVGGNLNATRIFDSGSRVISTVSAGVGIGINGFNTGTFSGHNVVLTNTGVLSLIAGTGTNVSSTTGNVTVWITPPTLQSVTAQGNQTTNTVFFNNTTTAISTTTASVVVAGGVGIGANLIVGTTLSATTATFNTISVTSSATYATITTVTQNSIYTAGGVGIGGDLTVINNTLMYGNLTVLGTYTILTQQTVDVGRKVVALSTSAGPAILSIDSGITVGPISNPFVKFLFDGINSWKSTGNFIPNTTRTYNLGSAGYQWNNAHIFNNNVYGQNIVWNTATSTSPYSGAAIVLGGMGIAENLNIGGALNVSGLVRFTNPTNSTGTTTGALVVTGGVGIGGDLHVPNIYDNDGLPYLTAAALAAYGVSKLFAGTDTAVSTSSGIVTVWNTSTLQSITNRSNSTTNIVLFNNTSNAVSSTTGAVVIAGGLGIKKDLFVGGDAVIYGSVTFTGAATQVLTTNTVFTDAILELHATKNGAEWTFNDAQDIGVRMHYFYNTGTNAWLGRKNGTGYLEWFSTATETNGQISGIYGTFKTGKIELTSSATSVSTVTGALIVAGGGGIGRDLWVGGTIYASNSVVLTAATLGNYGVSSLYAGTDTAVSSNTGTVTVWNTSTLQTVTSRGNSTNNAISISNISASTSTTTGALTVAGGVGIGGNLNVFGTVKTSNLIADQATIASINLNNIDATGHIQSTSNEQYAIRILSDVDSTSSFYVRNINSGTNAFSGFMAENDAGDQVALYAGSSNFNTLIYQTGTAGLYITPSIAAFNIGNNSEIDFYTRGVGPGSVPTLRLGSTGSVKLYGDLTITSSPLDTNPSTEVTITTNAVNGYSSFTLQNTSFQGQSWALEVAGNNHNGTNGSSINEGNFTLYDNVAQAYRFAVMKGTGNVLLNRTVDDSNYQLQVQGNALVTDNFTANTATFLTLTVTGTTQLNTLDVLSTATFESGLLAKTTSTFNKTVIIGSSALETSVTSINTTDPTSIDSFDALLYRSCRSVVQITDGDFFHLSEIILLHDNSGQVYKSEYGMIDTGNPLGEFSVSLVDNQVVLYYTAYDASTPLTVNVVRTTISV